MSSSPFAVVESRWWSHGNHSVRALFEAVVAIHYSNPSAYYYDMFTNRSSLSTVLNMRGVDKSTEVVYLATHGDAKNIGPNTKNAISRTEVRNILINANAGSQLKGLFLGTCLTGNAQVAKFLLITGSNGQKTHLEWVAGYRESVDWVDGSAIDMIFFSKLAELYVKNLRKRKGKKSPRLMAHEAASALLKLVPGAHSTYGFNIYFREGNELTSMFS
ncbi:MULTISPECIES: hypothetical protein [Pantoea]|uniref:hypothetical protein n=1 Tax=Pantoea TaxID=53335 RepID=UPI00057D0C21|nr:MULTISPECIES: hypothetical protein [Pantoea]